MTDNKTALPLPSEAADRLIAAHDGDVALLYLYIARTGALDAERAAGALCRTRARSTRPRKSCAAWASGGGPRTPRPRLPQLVPEDTLPEYRAEDLIRFAAEDPKLEAIYREAEQVFGRKLSPSDMKMLAGLYKHLGLPAEVLFTLLHYCAERAAERRPGSVPSPRSVEKEGYDWANREIMTLEQADDYIRFRREQRELTVQVKEVLNIRGRELSKTEREYVERWIAMGFSPEAVAIAYDRTLIKLGKLHWSYMDKIFQSWHAKKLHTPAEIEAGDSRRRAPAAEARRKRPRRAGGTGRDLRTRLNGRSACMPYDGKLLAQAREALEQRRADNAAEQQRRLSLVYARDPEIEQIDLRLRRQMAELVRLTVSRAPDLAEKLEVLKHDNLELQADRAERLTALGLPIDYLDEIVSCPICRDTGMDGAQPCRCLKKLYNQALTKELSALLRHGDESFERFDLSLYDEQPLEGRFVSPRFAMEPHL